ncbi:hypothetical protein IEO70_16435 [Bacillus sp. AGMB 02131]|uniref:Regulatory protein YrvL n=1 Tax=Peribacillus faecalis TaxID=2772559 RepID=A0A927HDX5_9BACI|nr:YrvL family regulatory protein [Peribacillus faecalis]MBD3109928.1 hypothetical protein [Peribacillus faecalis]
MSRKGNKSSFQSAKQKLISIILVTLFAGIACATIFGAFFFGIAGFLSLFNVQYTSLFALIKFVLCFFIIGFIMEPISRLMTLIISSKLSSKEKLPVIRMMFNCLFSWLSIYLADALVSGIDIPLMTEFLAVAVLYLAEIAFADKEVIVS